MPLFNYMAKHKLTDVDASNLMALCSVCGLTAIYRNPSKGKMYYRCKTQTQFSKFGGVYLRKRHILSSINKEDLQAVCKICGLTKIYNRGKGLGFTCSVYAKHNRLRFLENNPEHKQHSRIKRNLKVKANKNCNRCGFEPAHPSQMDLHHINHNHDDNRSENLEVLCANCHRLHHAENK